MEKKILTRCECTKCECNEVDETELAKEREEDLEDYREERAEMDREPVANYGEY